MLLPRRVLQPLQANTLLSIRLEPPRAVGMRWSAVARSIRSGQPHQKQNGCSFQRIRLCLLFLLKPGLFYYR